MKAKAQVAFLYSGFLSCHPAYYWEKEISSQLHAKKKIKKREINLYLRSKVAFSSKLNAFLWIHENRTCFLFSDTTSKLLHIISQDNIDELFQLLFHMRLIICFLIFNKLEDFPWCSSSYSRLKSKSRCWADQ